MARPKSSVTPVTVQVKFTLIPGLHDRFIAYFQTLPPGQRAATILRDLEHGMADASPVSDDDRLAEALANLL